jgi:hypothetical protein
VTNPTSRDIKKYGGLELRAYLDLKNAIHRYLLNKVDLEKVAAAPGAQTREQVLAVIQEAVSQVKAPLNVPERDTG